MARKIVIPTLPDMHWGAVPAERLERELEECVMPWLRANRFDALVQLGDWFHERLSLDSVDAKAAHRWMFALAQLCHQRGVPMRAIQGTLTHDYRQLENYRPIETEFPGFRIVTTTAHEELLPGFDVLWMPEVYPPDYSEHYSPFFFDGEASLVYDAIFGHGEIDVAAGWGQAIEGERFYGGTPTHEAALLLEHSSGPVQFGHIHKRFRHKKRLGYGGSFTRWCQGEPEPKGFDVLTLTERARGGWDVAVRIVENELAPVYRTVLAEQILGPSDPPDEIVRRIREEAAQVHKLRVKFAGYQIGIEEFSLVRGSLVEDRSVEIVSAARAQPAEEEVPEGEDAESEPRHERMSYLRDGTLAPQERLFRYIGERFADRPAVTLEEINELTAPLAAA